MNTLGEHLEHAERQLKHVADTLASESQLEESRARSFLLESRRTVNALHSLLKTTWGAAAESLRTIDGAQPQADRDSLVRLAQCLDRAGTCPPLTAEGRYRYRDITVVTAARHHIQNAEAIIRAHVGDDLQARSPDAFRLSDPGSRWMITERVAATATAVARVETRVYELWREPSFTLAHIGRSHDLLEVAHLVLRTPHQTNGSVLDLHEGGHRSLQRDVLSDVAAPLERLCQLIFARSVAGDLDGVSVRAVATTGVLVTGHLEVIARSARHRATDLWTGVLGEIREMQLHRVAAEATTARVAWQQLQAELRPLQPIGRPDVDLTREAAKVRVALDAVTRRGDQWRTMEDLVRSRQDVRELMQGTGRVAPDATRLATLLDSGLSRAQSADLCIRADQIPDRETYIEERLRRQWLPVPQALLHSVRTVAQGAETATHRMAISAAETGLTIAHESQDTAHIAIRALAAAPPTPRQEGRPPTPGRWVTP